MPATKGALAWFVNGQVQDDEYADKLQSAPRVPAKITKVHWDEQPGMKAGQVDLMVAGTEGRVAMENVALFELDPVTHLDDSGKQRYPEGFPGGYALLAAEDDLPAWTD